MIKLLFKYIVFRVFKKNIYVEEPINDDQTQHTEQTLVSCTAVKAGHTVSDSIEGTQKVLASNPSNPAKTPSQSTFFTTSTKVTIPSIFINTSTPTFKPSK